VKRRKPAIAWPLSTFAPSTRFEMPEPIVTQAIGFRVPRQEPRPNDPR